MGEKGRGMNERGWVKTTLRAPWAALALAPALLALAGCASAPHTAEATPKEPVAPAAAAPHAKAASAQVTQDPGGFSITQPTTASGDARADYEKAVRLLKAEKYDAASRCWSR